MSFYKRLRTQATPNKKTTQDETPRKQTTGGILQFLSMSSPSEASKEVCGSTPSTKNNDNNAGNMYTINKRPRWHISDEDDMDAEERKEPCGGEKDSVSQSSEVTTTQE
uniref:Uncharacterized protein n=1 Tax=Lygus hesperus TaxID=30085 RepID=A0A146KW63_LYGHE